MMWYESDVATKLAQGGGGVVATAATEEDEFGHVDTARAGLNPRHPPLGFAEFGGQLPLREVGVLAHLSQQGRDFSITQGVIGFGGHPLNIHQNLLDALCASTDNLEYAPVVAES